MSYVHSLRFKLMLLCILPLISCAFLFIGHSVIIAFQVRNLAADTYLSAVQSLEESDAAVQAVKGAVLDMGWITGQWLIVFAALFVCFYIPITINISRFIKPIRQLANYSDSLAKGDVSIKVDKNRTDEIGILQSSFQELVNTSQMQADIIHRIADGDISGEYMPRSELDIVGQSTVKMLESNNSMISSLSKATQQMSVITGQIADGSQALASGSSQQAATIEALSSMVIEVSKIPNESMKLAQKAMQVANDVKDSAESGNEQMKHMVTAVNDIRNASAEIQKVMKVIDDIAFQTNILALNAAVEAARAGQHGKGFAVVAEEVRSLATKSAEAAKDTDALITNSMEKANLGVKLVSETHTFIGSIVSGIKENTEILEEIVNLSSDQDVSISGISESLKQMSDVVQANSAMAEEYAASSEEMRGQADSIFDMVSQYKLREAGRTGF